MWKEESWLWKHALKRKEKKEKKIEMWLKVKGIKEKYLKNDENYFVRKVKRTNAWKWKNLESAF